MSFNLEAREKFLTLNPPDDVPYLCAPWPSQPCSLGPHRNPSFVHTHTLLNDSGVAVSRADSVRHAPHALSAAVTVHGILRVG